MLQVSSNFLISSGTGGNLDTCEQNESLEKIGCSQR